MDNGRMKKSVVEVNKYGEMAQFMRVTFKTIWPTVVVDLSTHAATFTKEIGLMTRHREKAYIYTMMVPCTQDNG